MDKQKHIDFLKKFKEELSNKVPIEKMILFGSRAYGKPHRWSDFDLIIVSKKFRNLDTLKRSLGFYDYWNYDYPVDFLCYTPKEFNKLKKQMTIVREAAKNGIEI